MYVGTDLGSTSVKAVRINDQGIILKSKYIKNDGIIQSVQELLKEFEGDRVQGIGITGSGRNFGSVLFDVDLIKNEVTAHARASMFYEANIRTIFELGGEDSFLCQLEENIMTNIRCNNLCMGGCGTMVEAIGKKLGVAVEDIGDLALKSKNRISVASKCGLFAQSTAVNKRNAGYPVEDILMAVCRGMVDNYFAILVGNSKLEPPYMLQGAVAKNKAIVKAFEEIVEHEVIVPDIASLMGAFGISLLLRDKGIDKPKTIKANVDYNTELIIGNGCSNKCEIIVLEKEGNKKFINNRCDKCILRLMPS